MLGLRCGPWTPRYPKSPNELHWLSVLFKRETPKSPVGGRGGGFKSHPLGSEANLGPVGLKESWNPKEKVRMAKARCSPNSEPEREKRQGRSLSLSPSKLSDLVVEPKTGSFRVKTWLDRLSSLHMQDAWLDSWFFRSHDLFGVPVTRLTQACL